MKKINLLLLFVFVITNYLISQTVIYSDNFEGYGANFTLTGASLGWKSGTFAVPGAATSNVWQVNNAACRLAGNRSLMITNGATTCTYQKSRYCDKVAYPATNINSTGYGCLTLQFDYQVNGDVFGGTVYDYLQPLYSIDGGTTWNAVAQYYFLQTATASATIGLPSSCDNIATLLIGFEWVNDNVGGSDVPAIVDNVVVKGFLAPVAPVNNTCASALPMTFAGSTASVSGSNSCANADNASPSCYPNNRNVWYTFVPPTTTNYYVSVGGGTSQFPSFAIWRYGTPCVSTTTTQVSCVANSANLATGSACTLTAGQTYYISVDNNTGGSPGTYTVTINRAISNDLIATPSVINSCGSNFASSTIGATNCGDGIATGAYNNVDNNAGTGGYAGGGDVGFSVENSSWYNFCNGGGASATYTITGTNTGGCTGVDGIQFAYFTGTSNNLTLRSGGTPGMNILSGSSFVSSAITLASGACAYVLVDGYGGTNCNYNLSVAASPACVILPISILYFDGYASDNENILKWATASEHNSKEFIIEKSQDGYNYQVYETIKAAGESNLKLLYEIIDSEPFEKGTYYRLKELDLDGSFIYTNSIFIDKYKTNSKFEIINIKPNPTNSSSKLRCSIPHSGQLTIEVFDSFGNLIYDLTKKVVEGVVEDEIFLSNRPKGVYFIKATFDNEYFKSKTILKLEDD